MSGLTVPHVVVEALQAIRIQTDVITALSSGGASVIIVTWARLLGIFGDANLTGFKHPFVLAFPLACFVLAVIVGYLIGSQVTGYYLEIANSNNASTGADITDARQHFFSDYESAFHWMMSIQLYVNAVGILVLAAWYGRNAYGMKGE